VLARLAIAIALAPLFSVWHAFANKAIVARHASSTGIWDALHRAKNRLAMESFGAVLVAVAFFFGRHWHALAEATRWTILSTRCAINTQTFTFESRRAGLVWAALLRWRGWLALSEAGVSTATIWVAQACAIDFAH